MKTEAFFDAWTIEHFLTGASVGAAVMKRNHSVISRIVNDRNHGVSSWQFDLVGVLCMAFAWETVEHYIEIGMFGDNIEAWCHGVEIWANRIISDPAIMLVGFSLAKRYPIIVWPARILSAIWFLVHVLFFPHSMYLHEIF